MRTIACEGNCPFLLLHFLVFVDNKMYIWAHPINQGGDSLIQ